MFRIDHRWVGFASLRALWAATTLVVPLLSSSAYADPLTLPADGQPGFARPSASLEQLQTHAETRAPRLRVAREAVTLARAELAAAAPGVPENPVIELAGGPRLSSEGTSYAFDATFIQSIYVGGERGARLVAAQKAVLLAEAQVQVERWSLHADIHQAYDRALIARRRVALSTEVEGFQKRLSDIAAKKAKAGEIATIDVRLSEIELAEARQHVLAAKNDYRLACLSLATLIGWTQSTPIEPADVATDTTAPPSLESLVARALELDPGRRAKVASVELAKARLTAERRAASITPAFGLSVGHEGGVAAEPSITTVQAIVSIPLPTSHKNQGGIARAQAELQMAEVERETHEQWLVSRIHELHAALTGAIERAAVFGDTILPRITENLVLLERAYAVGEFDLTATILARERFVEARLDALSAHAEQLLARAELERLLGSDLPEVTP